MYTNIPTHELKNIIENILNNNHYISKEEKEELLDVLDMIRYNSTTNFINKMRD
jgi:hypothetical protein